MSVEEQTEVYRGAGLGRIAFNLSGDPYYSDMAGIVTDAALRRKPDIFISLDLISRLGESARETYKKVKQVLTAQPGGDSLMADACRLSTLFTPRIIPKMIDGTELSGVSEELVDAVICSEAFHLFHPSPEKSLIPQVLAEIHKVLKPGGVLAFNFGPSHYDFQNYQMADHRKGEEQPGLLKSELAHPFAQKFHAIVYGIVKSRFPEFDRGNLWPPAATKIDPEYIKAECSKVGLEDLKIQEKIYVIEPDRLPKFAVNVWTVFFRWGQLSELTFDQKIQIIEEAVVEIFQDEEAVDEMLDEQAFHPTAVFTAIKE